MRDAAPKGAIVAERALVFGLHAVGAVLSHSPERILELWLSSGRDDPKIKSLRGNAEAAGIKPQPASADALRKLVGDVTHQGVVAAIRPLAPWHDNELLTAVAASKDPAFLLVLDGVSDPHNLGACLRSADAAGVQALVVPKDRSAHIDAVVRKVAAGAAEFVPVATVTNLARTLEALKGLGVWVVGTDGEAVETLFGADLNRPLALVLGAEGSGLRRLTREKCDFLVKIPMAGRIESLNVSVAAGIALFEARRQRSKLTVTP
jgi:23S rRNA (guanosine2251-2'-O)-methyltransferase